MWSPAEARANASTRANVRRIAAARVHHGSGSIVPVQMPARAIGFGVGLVLMMLALGASGCSRNQAHVDSAGRLPVLDVSAQQVRLVKQVQTEEVMGTVRAKTRATLEAKIPGRIMELPVTVGTHVERGDLIAVLDAAEIEARLDQARAALDQATRDLERFTALLRQQAVTQAEFDAVQARYKMAEAAVREARTMLGHAHVLAPFAGVITRKFADVGDLAAPGKPIVEIEDPNMLRLEADVPELLVRGLVPGLELAVVVPAAGVECKGVVAEVAPAADPGTRTVHVKLDLPRAEGLRSGMFGRVFVPVGDAERLIVPAPAVVRRGQMEMVFVIRDGRAEMRLVKTGKVFDNGVEILSGLVPGETIAVDGAARLREGQPVRVK